MDRRKFLTSSAVAALLPLCPRELVGVPAVRRRRRPSDANWPSRAAWQRLKDQVGGTLIAPDFPLAACAGDPASPACQALFKDLHNPYYIHDQPGLTQTLAWVGAWTTKPSVYAVVARNANDIAAAVNFARENDLRVVVKGGGHSYLGTSNAPDSLLVWTHDMYDIAMHDAFVPQGCKVGPQRAVTMGAGTIWMQAYEAVTTRGGAYVQGGGCTTVGVAGLTQSGGFGSFSKHYSTAAANLLEAEVVTADGQVRVANACTNPDLFWALKGGGGGSFGVMSKVTARVHELPEFWGGASFKVKAVSDDAYRALVRRFVRFYREELFNHHWGEQAHIRGDNKLGISMVSYGLSTEEAQKIWKPFLDWVKATPGSYTVEEPVVIGSMPPRYWWDVQWRKEHHHEVFKSDPRPGASPNNVWWNGDGGQVGQVLYAFESLWLPASLLEKPDALADTLLAASRHEDVELHFNKGLAGAPAEAIAAARDTATNPAVLGAFALAIIADGQGPAYPGIPGHEPDVSAGRTASQHVRRSMHELRMLAPRGGSYVSESNFFEDDWQHSYWGSNYERLAAIKKKYDPAGLFFVHNGVGSEEWSADGFTKL